MIVVNFETGEGGGQQAVINDMFGVEVIQREPNYVLIKYKKIMSFIFFAASLVAFYQYCSQIYMLRYGEIGFLKRLLFVNLLTLVIYNMLYSFEGRGDQWISRFLDNFINALMMTQVLFLNLVLIESHTNSLSRGNSLLNYEQQVRAFLLVKGGICLGVFVVLYFFMLTHSERLRSYITKLNPSSDSIQSQNLVGEYDTIDITSFLVFLVYTSYALIKSVAAFSQKNLKYALKKTKRSNNLYNLIIADADGDDFNLVQDLKVERFCSVFVFSISISLLALLFMPPQDEMLQFINESGIINVYLIVLSFLVSPVDEIDFMRYEAQSEAMKLQCKLYREQLKAISHKQIKQQQRACRDPALQLRNQPEMPGNTFLSDLRSQNDAVFEKISKKVREKREKIRLN
mmetsp:Transcript_15753/g.26579  ORF Transcript_15753/g.26579 Transcript_15753/m.26579 type:complete len:401 (+) Transcript_15753:971-2173(+)